LRCSSARKLQRINASSRPPEANSLDKFQLGIKDVLADFMIEAMGDNDEFVTKYMANNAFQATAFPVLAKVIFDAVRGRKTQRGEQGS
jgi:hypothetical protein